MIRRLAATLLISSALIGGTAGVAQARPVTDPIIEPGDCGPGQAWTTYNVRLDRLQTVCLAQPEHRLYQAPGLTPGLNHPWNPWYWINKWR